MIRPGTTAAARVEADRDRCCGSGLCVLRLPGIFDQDEDGVVTVLEPTPPESDLDEVASAVDACPSGALSLTEPR